MNPRKRCCWRCTVCGLEGTGLPHPQTGRLVLALHPAHRSRPGEAAQVGTGGGHSLNAVLRHPRGECTLVDCWPLLDPGLRHCGGLVRCCGSHIIPLHRDPPHAPPYPLFGGSRVAPAPVCLGGRPGDPTATPVALCHHVGHSGGLGHGGDYAPHRQGQGHGVAMADSVGGGWGGEPVE